MIYHNIFTISVIIISIFDLLVCFCILFLRKNGKLEKSSTIGLILTNLTFLGICYIVAYIIEEVALW
jgi:ABC-type Mn2+/Zn2+ transport system permease subunit